jgi:hypothetical protein
MRYSQKLDRRLLAFVTAALCLCAPVWGQIEQGSIRDVLRQTVEESTEDSPFEAAKDSGSIYVFGEFKPVSKGSNLVAVPVLLPGRNAWVSVLSSSGHPVANVSVLVEGVPFTTDASGIAALQIPKVQSLTLAIVDAAKKAVDQRKYGITSSGMLVCEPCSVDIYGRLLELAPQRAKGPVIAYAPLAVQAREPILVVGRNFAASPSDDEMIVDGLDAPILSGSPVALLATGPARVSVGPVRELFVRAGEESSPVREVDVCRVEFGCRERNLQPGQRYRAKVQVIGSNLPCIVDLYNRTANSVHLFDAESKLLPAKVRIVTPGGENNLVRYSLSVDNTEELAIETHLQPDVVPGAPGAEELMSDDDFRMSVLEATSGDITRLQRRLISAENRLLLVKQSRDAHGQEASLAADELDRANAEIKLLTNRQSRLVSMISSRRVILESLGGTEEAYRKAVELASTSSSAVVVPQNKEHPITAPPANQTGPDGSGKALPEASSGNAQINRSAGEKTAGAQPDASKTDASKTGSSTAAGGKSELQKTIFQHSSTVPKIIENSSMETDAGKE